MDYISSQNSSDSLADQYIQLLSKLIRCRGAAARVYGYIIQFDEESSTEPLPSAEDIPPRSQLRVPAIPTLLTENLCRLRTWERECGLRGRLRENNWLRNVPRNHSLHTLLDLVFTNLENQVNITTTRLERGDVDIEDKQWEASVIWHCDSMRTHVYGLAELQPVIQKFRASTDKGGPLASLWKTITSIRDKHSDTENNWIHVLKGPPDDTNALRMIQFSPALLLDDLRFIFNNRRLWVSRWNASGALELDGVPLSLHSIRQVFLHSVLLVLHVGFLGTVPFLVLYPVWLVALAVLGAKLMHDSICVPLNSGAWIEPMTSTPLDIDLDPERYSQEAWILMNGVGVNGHLLQVRLDRIANIFRRKISALPSRTSGILPDLLHNLLLRNSSQALPISRDVREAFNLVRDKLSDPTVTKVVLLAHSGGAIHASIVVGLLLQVVAHEIFSKLEIYTFGGFCSQFYNPPSSTQSGGSDGSKARSETITSIEELATPPGNRGETLGCIPHIEHYASRGDIFALMGVLGAENRPYIRGTLFEMDPSARLEGHETGFNLNTNYLAELFPPGETDGRRRGPWRKVSRLYQYRRGQSPMPGAASLGK